VLVASTVKHGWHHSLRLGRFGGLKSLTHLVVLQIGTRHSREDSGMLIKTTVPAKTRTNATDTIATQTAIVVQTSVAVECALTASTRSNVHWFYIITTANCNEIAIVSRGIKRHVQHEHMCVSSVRSLKSRTAAARRAHRGSRMKTLALYCGANSSTRPRELC
jgi:hypothetical protein